MRYRGQSDDQVDIRLSIDELMLVRNVLNEICTGLQFSENDFQTIFGVARGELEHLVHRATNVLDRLQIPIE